MVAAVPAQAAETVSVVFTQPDGGVSTGLYSGQVSLRVEGTGFSNGPALNDAFYLIGGSRDGTFYQLNFGLAPLVGYNGSNAAVVEAQNADNFIVGGLPAYDASHIYNVVLNTGAVSPTQLHFGVSDGIFRDNGGGFRITIKQLGAVPEPATWATMLLGLGLVGASMRRRKETVAYA
jgi:hypothetical protein